MAWPQAVRQLHQIVHSASCKSIAAKNQEILSMHFRAKAPKFAWYDASCNLPHRMLCQHNAKEITTAK